MKYFLKHLKEIIKDCSIPFKNFIHWNIYKIINTVVWYFLWAVFSAPIIIISLLYIFFLFPEISIGNIVSKAFAMTLSADDFSSIFDKNWLTAILSFLLFLAFLLFNFGKTYTYVLNLSLYKKYFLSEKPSFKKWVIIKAPTLLKYAQIFAWSSLFLVIPFVVFLWIFLLFLLFAGWLEQALSIVIDSSTWINWFSIWLLIALITCIVSFAYINFRTIFSVLFYVESDEFWHQQKTKALDFIKKSVKATPSIKKLALFLFVFILFWIVTIPYTYKNTVVEKNISDGTRYIQLVQIASMSGVTLPQEQSDELSTLSDQFKGKSGQDIFDFINTNTLEKMVLFIFWFLVINGLTEFLLYSYFIRVLVHQKNHHD